MHLSLKGAVGRNPLLNKVGKPLLSIDDAAAAYSLRSLGSGNPRVARVRRSSDDAEKDFYAADMGSGSVVDWVNGKQDTTLPCDVASAAAAYSLRSVNSNYAGSAVRVRRSSDDAEKDFTASDVSGGALVDWVNEVATSFNHNDLQSNWVDGLSGSSITSSTTFTTDGTANGRITYNYAWEIGKKYFITLSGSVTGGQLEIQNAQTGSVLASGFGTFEITAPSTTFRIVNDSASTNTITEISFVSNTNDGHVTTWYDQSGNGNNATQSTAGSQPKIVDGGVLVSGGLDFDGVDDYLVTTQGFIVELSQNPASVFCVAHPNNTNEGYLLTEGDEIIPYSSQFILNGSGSSPSTVWVNTTGFGSGFPASKTLGGFIYNGTTFQAYLNGSADGSAGTADINAETFGQTFIASRAGGTTHFFDGKVEELITYNSDQSSNRFKIESNINNHYGLYTNANDGFVTSWYDQSGNDNHATQSTAGSQPKIVDGGVLASDGIKFDGVDDFLSGTDNGSLDTIRLGEFSYFGVAKLDSFNNYASLFNLSSNSSNGGGALGLQFFQPSPIFGPHNTFVVSDDLANVNLTNVNNESLFTLIRDNSGTNGSGSNVTVYVKDDLGVSLSNSATQGWSSNSGTNYYIGSQNNVGEWNGKISEIIIYDTDQSANRTAIETNINNHYDIY